MSSKISVVNRVATMVLSTGVLLTSSHVKAELYGLGLVEGDLWQNAIQVGAQVPAVAEQINNQLLVAPFAAPVANSHGLMTYRNQSVRFELQAKHLDSDGKSDQSLNWSLVKKPRHGALSGVLPKLVYTPNNDYTGFDEVVFEVTDRDGNKDTGTIDIKVNGSYALFESGQVRPMAMNSRGDRLYVLNTPDGKLEIYDTSGETPRHLAGVTVGLDPVAVSLRNDTEAWVVNTLSDSVSIVDLSDDAPSLVRTLHVGDEPQDVVFAGVNKNKAYITTARRGQHSPSGLASMTPSVGRADVWVFDAESPADSPENIVNLYGMAPRALATSPDGSKVYVAIYKSGNKSTVVGHNFHIFGDNGTATKPGPNTDASGTLAPNTGVIAKHDGSNWRDLYGKIWDDNIYFDLPDYDVFELDANNPETGAVKRHSGVGNSLFNLAVNPVNGSVYVSNMDARNELKFEGHGVRSDVQTLRGRFIQNQITVINRSGAVLPRDLNPHLDDSRPEGSAEENAKSLSMPLEMAVDKSGETVYVTAYGSSKIGIFSTAELEAGTFQASERNQIEVSGGGPAGIVLDEARGRMYVLTRFNNAISVVDIEKKREIASVEMYNPEPDFIVEGRPFLYDARFSSGRGDSSCGSCHLFGDMDGIAWELGNPDGVWTDNPREYASDLIMQPALRLHHPMKGPMITQSLRGLEFQGPQHWRGDRTGAVQKNGESLERAAFKEFRGAFTELLGKPEEPTEEELNKFADFVLQMRYPPNPNRKMDDTLTAKAERGANVYFNKKTTGFDSYDRKLMISCNDCHEVNEDIERFGTNTMMSFEGVESEQDMKVPHLRNVYSRIGMFGQVLRGYDHTSTGKHMGDQVTGYGLSHDGAVDTMETFLTVRVFHVEPDDVPDVFEYVTQVPTGLAPIVGQQVTLTADSQSKASLVDLMTSEALAHMTLSEPKPKCDLIAWGNIGEERDSWLMTGRNQMMSASGQTITDDELRAASRQQGNSITYMCAPAGSGYRMALDRDEDGRLNGVDSVTQGRKATSVVAAYPSAPNQYVEMVLDDSRFPRDVAQRANGTFPDFTDFGLFSAVQLGGGDAVSNSPPGVVLVEPSEESTFDGAGDILGTDDDEFVVTTVVVNDQAVGGGDSIIDIDDVGDVSNEDESSSHLDGLSNTLVDTAVTQTSNETEPQTYDSGSGSFGFLGVFLLLTLRMGRRVRKGALTA